MDTHTADGEAVIVALPAEIDLTNAEHVYDQLYAALISGAPVIIADLAATVFCDSAGMYRLIMIQKQAAARYAQLRLVVPPAGSVRHVLELLGLDQRIPVYPTIAEAASLPNAPVSASPSSYSPRHYARQDRRETTP